MSEPQAFDWRGWINIGRPDLAAVIRGAYELSGPQGLGILHYRDGTLSDEEVAAIIARESHVGSGPIVAGMDYVNGRSVKMHVRKEPKTGDYYVKRDWYDHGRAALEELLVKFGVEPAAIDRANEAAEEAYQEYLTDRAARAQIGIAYVRGRGGRIPNPALNWRSVETETHDAIHAASDEKLIEYDFERQEYFIPADPDASSRAEGSAGNPATDEPLPTTGRGS